MQDESEAASRQVDASPAPPETDTRELGQTPYRDQPLATMQRELDLAAFEKDLPDNARNRPFLVTLVLTVFIWAAFGVRAESYPELLLYNALSAVCAFLIWEHWFAASVRPPKLRTTNGKLMLRHNHFSVGERRGVVDLAEGVHIDVHDTGIRFNGVEQARITVVGRTGRLSWTLMSLRHAHALRNYIEQFLYEAQVPVRGRHDVLGGAVRTRCLRSGAMEISWSLPDRRNAVPWGVVGGTIAAGIAVQFGADSEAMIWAAVGIAALIVIVIRAWRPERPFGRRSRLVVGRTGWRLDQRIGWRREPYTGTGALEATYVFSTDVPGGRRVVELRSDGKLVTTIGEGLTEPELRFIIERIREATSLHSAPLPASDPNP